jgi:hypothetical protein
VIARRHNGALLLITQPDHAHLAGRVMEHCVPLATRPRREAILHAAAEHDNGWAEADAAPALQPDAHAVADFMAAPLSVRQGVWPRAVDRLASDPWAAALVAHHAITVYGRFRPEPDWASFFTGMTAMRDELLAATGLPMDDLVGDYAFVRLADLISLTFCTGWTAEQRYDQWAIRRAGTCVVVTPDLFGGRTIAVQVQAREIADRPYHSDAELRGAVDAARWTTLEGEVAGRERAL